jgi:predicted nucleotidyltransferase
LRAPGHIPAEERAGLDELKQALSRELGARLQAVILFGSLARGRYSEDSDIDVLVLVSPDQRGDGQRVVDAAVEVMLRRPSLVISPVVLTPARLAELKRLERRFALDIEREGIRL